MIWKCWRNLLASVWLGYCGQLAAQTETLRIGVIPYLTPSILISLFQPLRLQLEKDLGQPVQLFTAPDVRSFVKRTLQPDFDILITAAHQARLAQVEGGYLPGTRFTGPLRAAVVVAGNSPIQRLEELRGRRIAITDRSILVNIALMKILGERGIGERDVQLLPVNSQNTGILNVASGDAEAAIVAHFALDQSPPEQRNSVRRIFESADLPNVTILLSPRLDAAKRTRIRQSLLQFPETPEGSRFLEQSRFLGIQSADERFMKTLDPYLPETRRQLGQ